ncbi:MAG: cytidine deaminase [Dysgonamonadaceae bacterium]|jgi:cytidine deaminase|nr:cytidine deaminase [Dysgonamonadaceae bacterium]
MKNLNISAKISVCIYEELNQSEKKLIDAAKEATQHAYAPYSHFQVGAAVLLSNNEIITGNNQENVAYPSGLCAERTALFYANSRFPDEIVNAVAIAAYTNNDFTDEPITPCGACRQVILETQNRYKHPVRILLYGKKTIYLIEKITDLLPLSFNADYMTADLKIKD